jgi:hypothetical protein
MGRKLWRACAPFCLILRVSIDTAGPCDGSCRAGLGWPVRLYRPQQPAGQAAPGKRSITFEEKGKALMSGRTRLPGGERRKASQRDVRRGQIETRIMPAWQPGNLVRWKGRSGTYRRDTGDGEHSEILIGERVYRVRPAELG